MEPLCAVFRRYLRSHRLKYTPERADILNAIIERDDVFEVDQLLMEMRRRGHRVSKATIYRTLNLLVQAGLARELDFGEGFKRYEHQAGETQHDYMICTSCGKVARFQRDAMDRLQAEIGAELGFTVKSRRLKIYGLCSDCRGYADSGRIAASSARLGAGPETG